MQNKKFNARGQTVMVSNGIGIIAAIVISILVTALTAALVMNESFKIEMSTYLAILTQFLSVFVGVCIGGKLAAERKAMVCCSIAAVVFFIYIAGAIVLFDGISVGVLGGVIATLMALILGVLLCSKPKKANGIKKRSKHTR